MVFHEKVVSWACNWNSCRSCFSLRQSIYLRQPLYSRSVLCIFLIFSYWIFKIHMLRDWVLIKLIFTASLRTFLVKLASPPLWVLSGKDYIKLYTVWPLPWIVLRQQQFLPTIAFVLSVQKSTVKSNTLEL